VSKKIIVNGVIEDAVKYNILLINRAFRYGDGLFETIRVYNGFPLFAELHYKRLTDGLSFFKINAPEIHDFALFYNNLIEIIKANNINSGGRIRYTVCRASEGFYKPLSDRSLSIIEAAVIENNTYLLNEKGLLVFIYDDVLKPINKLTRYKNPFAFLHVLASQYQTESNYEILLLNEQNNICEGINSNIFILKNKVLYTPHLEQACVNGIMRQLIIQYISKLMHIEILETTINRTDLLDADEILFTNVVQGVKWAMGFDKKRYYNTFSKSLIENINNFINSQI